jgi:hypothetical protein
MTTPKTAALDALTDALAALDAAYQASRTARTATQAAFPVGHPLVEAVESMTSLLQTAVNNAQMDLRKSMAAATKAEV